MTLHAGETFAGYTIVRQIGSGGMGEVYLDANFSMSRPPLLLRTGVREIMTKYNLPLRPVERKWMPAPYNETFDVE